MSDRPDFSFQTARRSVGYLQAVHNTEARAAVADQLIATLDAAEARITALEQAVVKMAIPYEAIRMDAGSQRWIAPKVWKAIMEATEQGRAVARSALSGAPREEGQ